MTYEFTAPSLFYLYKAPYIEFMVSHVLMNIRSSREEKLNGFAQAMIDAAYCLDSPDVTPAGGCRQFDESLGLDGRFYAEQIEVKR